MTTKESLENLAGISADIHGPRSGDVHYLVDQLIGIVMVLDEKITLLEEREEREAEKEKRIHNQALEESMGSHGQG